MSEIKPIVTGPNSWDFFSVSRDEFIGSIELQNFDEEKQTCELFWQLGGRNGSAEEYREAFRFATVQALFERKVWTVKAIANLSDEGGLALYPAIGYLTGREFGAGSKRCRRFSCDRYDLVRHLAEAQMGKHLDLRVWAFGFDSAKRRLGVCKYDQHVISLSRHFVDLHSLDEINQVMRHEIAHALAGSKAGHGSKWKKIATQLGYRHERISGDEIGNATAKLIGTCPNGHTVYRHRKPKSTLSCSRCSPRFDPRFVITWSAR
jgi:predicted SprT family Zn-dependent metalloprotease